MSKLLPCPFCGADALMWPSHTKTDKNGLYEIVGCSNIDCFIEPTTGEYLPYEEAVQRWNTRAAPAPCDKLETVGWLWEYAQYRTDDRGCYGYETVITESNPTDHVSPAEKLRNVRELVTRQNAEKVIAAKDARIAELEAKLETANALVTCCCGSLVNDHDMGSGHSPVDQYHYAMIQLEADNKRLREALVELVDLMQGVIDGEYTPDSFTLQPARAALGEVKP